MAGSKICLFEQEQLFWNYFINRNIVVYRAASPVGPGRKTDETFTGILKHL